MPKTYSEDEVRELLHDALQYQEAAMERERKAEGLTLEEIAEIAEEVGIDPTFISMAADVRAEENAVDHTKGLFGQTKALTLRSSVDGELSREKANQMVTRFRKVMGVRGSLSLSENVLEWEADKGGGERLQVEILSHDGSSDIKLIHTPRRQPPTEWIPALMPLLFPLIILFSGGPLFAFVIFLLFAAFMSATAFGASRKKVVSGNQREHRKVEGLVSGIESILKTDTVPVEPVSDEVKRESRIDATLLDEVPLNAAPNAARTGGIVKN